MKAIVYINGLIGSFDGVQGLELTDVVAQLQSQKGFDEIELRIGSSEGGIVQVGKDIRQYLLSHKKPITTIIDSYCASITSILFLAGDVRIMKQGARLMIHTPWGQPQGDADLLDEYSKSLRTIENELATIYNDKTGIGKEALIALMKNETDMTAEEALALGFATEISNENKIVALNINEMSKKTLKEQLAAIQAKLTGKNEPVNLKLQDGTGVELEFETENTTPQVGDKATVDGAPAIGEYVMPDGKTYVFDDSGALTEIKEPEAGDALTEEQKNAINKLIAEGVAEAVNKALEKNETLASLVQISTTLSEQVVAMGKNVKGLGLKTDAITANPLNYKNSADDVYDKYNKKS